MKRGEIKEGDCSEAKKSERKVILFVLLSDDLWQEEKYLSEIGCRSR